MARKAKAVRRRARKSFNVINAALGLAQANIVTQTLMDVNPIQFIVGDSLTGGSFAASGSTARGGAISLLEIVQDPQLLTTIGSRAVDPTNIVTMAVKSAALDIGARFALRALARPRRNINKSLRMLNLGVSL